MSRRALIFGALALGAVALAAWWTFRPAPAPRTPAHAATAARLDGVTSAYATLQLPGFTAASEASGAADRLDVPMALELFEIRDSWGNPLVYLQSKQQPEASPK